jgi:Flp pilus assembly protein TadG
LVTPVLLILILGIVDYGRAMFDKMELLSAVRSGAQLALAETTLNTTHVTNAVVAATNSSITSSDVTTTEFCECADGSTITCGGTCADASDNRYFLTITASMSFDAFYLATPLTLSESVTIRTQ